MDNESLKQKEVVTNLEHFNKSREEVFTFSRDYAKMMPDVDYKEKSDRPKQEETGFKILTPKQMRQRLPIPLAQVKAGNNSENLLNEIRQIL